MRLCGSVRTADPPQASPSESGSGSARTAPGVAVFALEWCVVGDSFRELEKPQPGRQKDIVLMATVSSFESLTHPSRSDQKQFHELFVPTYLASSDEARRQAVAALSQCAAVPEATSLFIAREPIGIAAIFLTRSAALSPRLLMQILRTASPAHARAIECRDDLSPQMIERLVDLHREHRSRGPVEIEPAATEARRLAREEDLREKIKALVRAQAPVAAGPGALAAIGEAHLALIVRFARTGETGMVGVALADALGSSHWLGERILLDVSGSQLATTLVALDMPAGDAGYVLSRLYPHLARAAEKAADGSRATVLLAELDRAACIERVESWRRADAYTWPGQPQAPANSDAAHVDAGSSQGEKVRRAAKG